MNLSGKHDRGETVGFKQAAAGKCRTIDCKQRGAARALLADGFGCVESLAQAHRMDEIMGGNIA
jgi:hypothetical protein